MGQTKIVRFSCHFSRQNKPVLRHKQIEAAYGRKYGKLQGAYCCVLRHITAVAGHGQLNALRKQNAKADNTKASASGQLIFKFCIDRIREHSVVGAEYPLCMKAR